MRIAYDEGYNCYVTNIKLRVGRYMRSLRAVIDTGATNTTIALSALVKEQILLDFSHKLERHAQKAGVRQAVIRSVAEESNTAEIYAYNACFDNVIVGGHLMKKLHARIMMNGARGICVIGNDFLNMCKYYHNAGEHQLTVENPVEQRYYESFSGKRVLHNSLLDILLFENSVDGCMLEEDDIAAETLRKGEKILKENNEREKVNQQINSTDKSPEEIEEERIRKKTEEIMKEYGLS